MPKPLGMRTEFTCRYLEDTKKQNGVGNVEHTMKVWPARAGQRQLVSLSSLRSLFGALLLQCLHSTELLWVLEQLGVCS